MKTFRDEQGSADETIWTYDSARGWLNEKEDDSGSKTTYTYTKAGRLETRTWDRTSGSDNYVTTYDYDEAGQRISIDYQIGTSDDTDTKDVLYTFDRAGRVTSVKDGVLSGGDITGTDIRYTHTYKYFDDDDFDPEIEDVSPFSVIEEHISGIYGSGNDRVITRSYEDGEDPGEITGRLSRFEIGSDTDPDEDYDITYGFDNAGRINKVTDSNSIFDYTYLTDSNLISKLTGKQGVNLKTEVNYTYEEGRNGVLTISNNEKVGTAREISKYTYRYDELGRRTDVVNTSADSVSFPSAGELSLFTYNDNGEVTLSKRHSGNNPDSPGSEITAERFTYAFDDIGNRTTANEGTSSTTHVGYIPDALNQYDNLFADDGSGGGTAGNGIKDGTEANTATLVYDDDGNLLDDGTYLYTYDGENRLKTVNPKNLASGDYRLSFEYDYLGRRVKKVRDAYNGSTWNDEEKTITYLYDGWNLVTTYCTFPQDEFENDLFQTYTWGLDLSGSLQGAGGVGGLLALEDFLLSEPTPSVVGVHYHFMDANGNVVQVINDDGELDVEYEYGPFGEIVKENILTNEVNLFLFSTKLREFEDVDASEGTWGRYYYGYRFYDPELGRWLNRDPINELGHRVLRGAIGENALFEDDVALYVFVKNDGINNWDFLGLCICCFKGRSGRLMVDSSCSGSLGLWVIDEKNAPADGILAEEWVAADGFVVNGTTYKIDGSTCVEISCSGSTITIKTCVNFLARLLGKGKARVVPAGEFGGPPKEPATGSRAPIVL